MRVEAPSHEKSWQSDEKPRQRIGRGDGASPQVELEGGVLSDKLNMKPDRFKKTKDGSTEGIG